MKNISKKLSLRELFFIALGGESPFISLISFGTFTVAIAGRNAPLAALIGLCIVLLNGLVIYYLAQRIYRIGGYYSYAFFGLSQRLGFQSGWSYILFGLTYGSSLMAGGSYIFHVLTKFDEITTTIIVLIITLILTFAGVKISAKYAEIVSFGELIVISILALFFLYQSNFNIYNPFEIQTSSDALFYSILFSVNLMAGYEALNPLSQETREARRVVGLASLLAIIATGVTIFFFLYSLGSVYFTGNLTNFLVNQFGIFSQVGVSLVALSDAILGCIVFIIAVSRVIAAMAEDEFIPKLFSKPWRSRPIFAELLTYAVFSMIILILTKSFGLYNTLEITGALAGLSNILVHLQANFALFRISLKRIHKRIPQILVSLGATIISAIVLANLIPIVSNYIVYFFFGWIITGFVIIEAIEIARTTKEEED